MVKEYERADTKFSRDVDFAGQKYIKWKTSMGSGRVCSQNEFDTGKVIIKCCGKVITKIF